MRKKKKIDQSKIIIKPPIYIYEHEDKPRKFREIKNHGDPNFRKTV